MVCFLNRNSTPGLRYERAKKSFFLTKNRIGASPKNGPGKGSKKSVFSKYLENAAELRENKIDVIPLLFDALFAGMRGLGRLHA